MKKLLRAIYLVTALCVSLNAFSQKNAYKGKTEQKALKMAYNLLKVYYPAGELCVSDSIWDQDWVQFIDEVDKETRKDIEAHYLKHLKYEEPVYSKHISKLFKNEFCDSCQYKYVADFSAPFKNYIQCEILPIDRMIGILGCPEIFNFLFKYDEDGEIVRMSRHLRYVE